MDNYDPNNWNDNNNTNQNQNINGNQHPNQNYFNNDYPVPPAKPKDKLATFSLILAIAGCVTSIVYYISLPCTISAIVLAILSRSRIGHNHFIRFYIGTLIAINKSHIEFYA